MKKWLLLIISSTISFQIVFLGVSSDTYSAESTKSKQSKKRKIELKLSTIHLKIGGKGGFVLGHIQSNNGSINVFSAVAGGGVIELIAGSNIALEINFMYQQRGGISSAGTREIHYLAFPFLIKVFQPFGETDKEIFVPFLGLGMNTQFLQRTRLNKIDDSAIKDTNFALLISIGFALSSPDDGLDFTFEWRYEQGINDIGVNEIIRTRTHEFLFGFMVKVF